MFAEQVIKILIFYTVFLFTNCPALHYTMFLYSHINSCSSAFHCLLTSSGSFNPTTVPSQHIRFLCMLINCQKL